ncbi:MAG TPA: calcium-binding protein, partial [Solirubrobacteraceae bacterium]|nr:calcium-binding protein [Solirubrobacteraceae bacterium]
MLNDPEPYIGGNFGGSQTGVGDIVGGPGAPANEVLVGGFRFDNFTEASQNTMPDVNFMNATLDKNLMTIPHPEGKTGDGFGVGLTPMGDINKDGFLDFAVSAYFASGPFGGQGRAWIFKSDNSPPPPPPTAPAPLAAGPVTPKSEGESLRAGPCANRSVGTSAADTIMGSIAGDEIFGFGGNDTIRGFAGRDCIDGQGGNDTLRGDDDNDKVVGGSGADRIDGGEGRDQLFGGSGNDRLDGGTENDMIAGGSGNDRLLGGAGNDRLYGEAGTDRIIGGGGRNIIDGGRGNDSIEARNGERDRIACGPGRDRVRADRFDRLNSCEIVSFGGKITNRGALPPRTTSAARARSAQTSGNRGTSR